MTAALPPLLLTQSTTTTTTTRSTHLQDPLLLPFLAPSFSPTAYLNASLPRPPPSATPSTTTTKTTTTSSSSSLKPQPPHSSTTGSLAAITQDTNSQLSRLSALTTTLSTLLTALTDEILRASSSRLGYEVESLQSGAEELLAALEGSLGSAVSVFGGLLPFLPPPLSDGGGGGDDDTTTPAPLLPQSSSTFENAEKEGSGKMGEEGEEGEVAKREGEDGDLHNLRTLLHTRTALQRLKTLFSLAMAWEMPPSLLLSSSPNSHTQTHTPATANAEARGWRCLDGLRAEIGGMLDGGGGGRARARIQELRECVGVWRGTSEEKGRARWVEDLGTWVEEEVRRRGGLGDSFDVGGGGKGAGGGGKGGEETGGTVGPPPTRTGSGAGFLRRLREEIYME
ncbi:MAG: hypothetical protein Q9202_003114 [Teloschistes flavicans]